jgi:hypothetical protein
VIRQDYIIRLIEQLVQVVARILGMKGPRRHDEMQAAINDALMRLAGLNGPLAAALTPEGLVSFLSAGGALDAGRALAAAELLRLEAELLEEQGKADAALDRRIKALTVGLAALAAIDTDVDLGSLREGLRELARLVPAERLDAVARQRLGVR